MIDAAEIGAGDRVLEVGAGSGYAAAVISRLAGEVFAIERHASARARGARRGSPRSATTTSRSSPATGSAACPTGAVRRDTGRGAAGTAVPQPLKDQLEIGGKLIMPVGGEDVQQLRCVTRTGEKEWESDDIAPVRFVPLVAAARCRRTAPRRPATTARRRAPHAPELIAEHAVPLPEIDDPAFAEAFDRFADRRVVMLGECSHGTHEFYDARAAITRRLRRAARLHHRRRRGRLARRRGDRPLRSATARIATGPSRRSSASPPGCGATR